MKKRTTCRFASALLAVVLLLSALPPITVYAEEAEPKSEPAVFDEAASDAAANPDDLGENEDTEEDGEEEGDTPAELVDTLELSPVADYATFLADLKLLETYASSYVESHPTENANALVINYIRTGVERYTSSTWATMAGAENTAFTDYVTQQDAEKGTTASALKDLDQLTLPNGDLVDLGHMFGTLDITYYATVQGMTAEVIQARADIQAESAEYIF